MYLLKSESLSLKSKARYRQFDGAMGVTTPFTNAVRHCAYPVLPMRGWMALSGWRESLHNGEGLPLGSPDIGRPPTGQTV